MNLLEATQIAVDIISKLIPCCDKVEVAGSIRRGKGEVRDIDIVAIPNEDKLMAAGYFGRQHLVASIAGLISMNGPRIASFSYPVTEIEVDIYWATEQTWGTLLLIRTGEKMHNIKLCTLAKKKGWHLKASGDGLFDSYNRRIAGDTEEGIFKALGLPFIPPGQREVRYPAAFRRTTPQAKEKILDITT